MVQATAYAAVSRMKRLWGVAHGWRGTEIEVVREAVRLNAHQSALMLWPGE